MSIAYSCSPPSLVSVSAGGAQRIEEEPCQRRNLLETIEVKDRKKKLCIS